MGEEVIFVAIYSTAARLGYASLKPCQENPVKTFISGRGIFVSPPTGYGRSFCYYCLPWVFDFLKGKQSPYHFVNINIFYVTELHSNVEVFVLSSSEPLCGSGAARLDPMWPSIVTNRLVWSLSRPLIIYGLVQ